MPSAPTSGSVVSSPARALIPASWPAIEGLVCGFGDRDSHAPAATLLLEQQVHGTRIVDAGETREAVLRRGDDGFARIAEEADALVAAGPGLIVGVRTADCVPLLLVAPRARWAAAVHAGWRGTLAGIAARAVEKAGEAGIRPDELVAALGPSIGPCCYEVSPDLGEAFARQGMALPTSSNGWADAGARPHLDLRAANRLWLERSGVPAPNVESVGPCTRCRRDCYHSFRADPNSQGRQVSWIGWV